MSAITKLRREALLLSQSISTAKKAINTTFPDLTLGLTEDQKFVFDSLQRFNVLNIGRQYGKSHLAAVAASDKALTCSGAVVFICGLSYANVKEAFWQKLQDILPANAVMKTNKTDLEILFWNGSRIVLKSLENANKLRGASVDLLIIDEAAYIDAVTWNYILEPLITARKGSVIFTSTPAGRAGFWFDIYHKCQAWDGWFAITRTTRDGWVEDDEVDRIEKQKDPLAWRQENLAEFTALQGQVYYTFDPTRHVKDIELPARGPILAGMDFNVSPFCVSLGFQRPDDGLHIFSEIYESDTDTARVSKKIRDMFPGRQIIVCPDASGNSRKTSAGSETDLSLIKKAGLHVDLGNRKANPRVRDRVNAVNSLIHSQDGSELFSVDPNCTQLIASLNSQTWDTDKNEPSKKEGYDHPLDGLGYLVYTRFNKLTNKKASVGKIAL